MTINFIKQKNIYLLLSIFLTLISIFILIKKELNFGLEFYGGTEIELQIIKNLSINDIKKTLKDVKNIKINYLGSDKTIQIKTKNIKNNLDEIKNKLNKLNIENFEILKSNYIGSEINKDTIKKSIIAIILSIVSITIYLIVRFNHKFALSAIITLLHDILLIVAFISWMNIELNLITLSAIFTIFGYSINDTIIIFDRIRENIKNDKLTTSLDVLINNAINSTLSRTINTSLSTTFVTIILMIFSNESLYMFSLILTIGIIIGTYSSIYISALSLTFLKKL